MADKKISELVSITGSATAADDYFVVVDTSGAVTHKISREELNNAIEQDVLSTVDINGGTIDGTVIGATTAAAGTFTDLTADGGTIKLDGNYPVGTANVALGNLALSSGSLSGGLNTAVGNGVMLANTSGSYNSGFGTNALITNQSGSFNTGIGKDALYSNISGNHNTAIGNQAGYTAST